MRGPEEAQVTVARRLRRRGRRGRHESPPILCDEHRVASCCSAQTDRSHHGCSQCQGHQQRTAVVAVVLEEVMVEGKAGGAAAMQWEEEEEEEE